MSDAMPNRVVAAESLPPYVLLTGATGFIGRPLVEHLAARGCRCTIVSRSSAPPRDWAPPAGTAFLGHDDPWPRAHAVVNLAGESIVGLWTARKRQDVLESRMSVTRRLVDWMRRQGSPPRMFVSGSAVGWYGNRPGETLTEDSTPDPQRKFRWQVCQAWEDAARAASSDLNVRTVFLRIGNVMHRSGGYLGRALPWIRRGFAFVPGRADAMFSWIALPDLIRTVEFALTDPRLAGPVNAVAPEPVSQGQAMRLLAKACGVDVAGRVPAGLLRMLLGEFSTTMLDDQAVVPRRALNAGFEFQCRTFAEFVRSLNGGQ